MAGQRGNNQPQLPQMCLTTTLLTLLILHALPPTSLAQGRNFDRQLLRKFFSCPVCDPYVCPTPPGYESGTCELVLQPGVCACCQVCAKQAGEKCGLDAGRCGKGLACRPLPDDPDSLGAILSGRAVCMF